MYDNDVNTKVNTMITKGKIHPQTNVIYIKTWSDQALHLLEG